MMSFPYWFKTYHGISCDPKIAAAAKALGMPKPFVTAAWLYILECASNSSTRGTVKNLNSRVFEIATEFPADKLDALLNELTALNMVQLVQEDGERHIIIANWEKHQSSEHTKGYETRRKAAYRRDKAEHERLRKEIDEMSALQEDSEAEKIYDAYSATHRDGDKQESVTLIKERLKDYAAADLLKAVDIYHSHRVERNQLNTKYCYAPQNFFKEDKIREFMQHMKPSERISHTDKQDIEQFERHYFSKVLTDDERQEAYWQVDLAEAEGHLKFPQVTAAEAVL